MKINLHYFFHIILLCISINSLNAQQSKVDSLQKVLLKAKEDTGKVTILNAIAIEYKNINTDTVIYYAKVALKLSEKINYTIGITESYSNREKITSDFTSYKELFNRLINCIPLIEDRKEVGSHSNLSYRYENRKNSFFVIEEVEKLENYYKTKIYPKEKNKMDASGFDIDWKNINFFNFA